MVLVINPDPTLGDFGPKQEAEANDSRQLSDEKVRKQSDSGEGHRGGSDPERSKHREHQDWKAVHAFRFLLRIGERYRILKHGRNHRIDRQSKDAWQE